jgi:hypothetical protein
MVVDSSRGTFTSDGDGVEKSSTGLFCILLFWSVFIAVPGNKENICLQIGISIQESSEGAKQHPDSIFVNRGSAFCLFQQTKNGLRTRFKSFNRILS